MTSRRCGNGGWPGRGVCIVGTCLATWLMCLPGLADGQHLSGSVSIDGQGWFETPVYPDQRRASFSLMLGPEYRTSWRDHWFLIAPFVRWDQTDSKRTHCDMRELLWAYSWDTWELRAGIGRVFWGVTESQHLVDVINQTDLVENLDGEDKLGQTMVHLGLHRSWGTVDVFVLPGFRARTFPGPSGRPQFPLRIATELTEFESRAGRRHVDAAARWSHVLGPADIGVAHFRGTSREPRFGVGLDADRRPVLIPHYDQVEQTSLDLSWVSNALVWKLEAINRASRFERFAALAAGVEYTMSGVSAAGADLGLLAEYLWDERGRFGQNPFDDDIFLGSRLALNDVGGTEVLSGVVIDRHSGGSVFQVEASRRVGTHWRLNVEGRGFFALPVTDFLYPARADDHVKVSIERFF